MTIFTDFFSGQSIQGQQFKGQNLSLNKGTTKFSWSIPSGSGPIISQIMNITNVNGNTNDKYIIELPPANQSGAFKSILFVNKSSAEIIIHSCNDDPLDQGEIIKTLLPYDNSKKITSAFFIYLENDKTVPGIWFDVAFGASGIVLPSGIDGLTGEGIKYDGQYLFRVTDTLIIKQNSFLITKNDSTKLLINNFTNSTSEDNVVILPSTSDPNPETKLNNSGFFVYVLNISKTQMLLMPSFGDTINGRSEGVIVHYDFSLCVCLDKNNPKNWITFLSNHSLAPDSPLYLDAITVSKNTEITHKMNSSTLICMSEMTPVYNNAPNIYSKIELLLPDPSTLPPAPTGNGFNFYMVNRGNGEVRLNPGDSKINNFSGSDDWMTFGPRTSCQVITDGKEWYTLMHGVSSGRIIFFNTGMSIGPEHFGANLLYYGTSECTVTLNNGYYLWDGFRVTISSGNTDGHEPNVVVKALTDTKLNGYTAGQTTLGYHFIKDLFHGPFGTSTFVFSKLYGGWWQI